MADKPDSPKPNPKDLAVPLKPVKPKPEQIWPPPEPEPIPGSPPEDAVELDWSDEVEKIDEAIDEIRKLNGGLGPEAEELLGEEDDELPTADEVEELIGESPERPLDQLVAGSTPAPLRGEATSAVPAKRRVRPHSENELGQLWSNVFFSAEHAAPRAVVVTGVRRGDGASQVATALALLGAEANEELRIALVDFNLRDPAVAGLLGLKREPGLTDVLLGQIDLDSAMQALTLKNGNTLHVMTGGSRPEHPLGLLKGRPVRTLIDRLRVAFDHVIIDTASSDRFADPQVIGSQVDAAILVCRAGRTARESAAEAKKRLDLAGVRCLGLVMNQRRDPIPSLLYRMT